MYNYTALNWSVDDVDWWCFSWQYRRRHHRAEATKQVRKIFSHVASAVGDVVVWLSSSLKAIKAVLLPIRVMLVVRHAESPIMTDQWQPEASHKRLKHRNITRQTIHSDFLCMPVLHHALSIVIHSGIDAHCYDLWLCRHSSSSINAEERTWCWHSLPLNHTIHPHKTKMASTSSSIAKPSNGGVQKRGGASTTESELVSCALAAFRSSCVGRHRHRSPFTAVVKGPSSTSQIHNISNWQWSSSIDGVKCRPPHNPKSSN